MAGSTRAVQRCGYYPPGPVTRSVLGHLEPLCGHNLAPGTGITAVRYFSK
jgi:hypothetical protein